MSKVTFQGKINIDTEEELFLRTNNGKTGYKIIKFQIISTTPGVGNQELIGKITSASDPNVGPVVDFSTTEVLAVAYHTDLGNANVATSDSIILDNQIVNQNIFVQISDSNSGTTPCNYYIELEKMSLSDSESTQITLKNMRTITS
tara:strand:+ start:124 stop:561 length:438 start_codon:yes stop_codon:yes gene_type:complete